MSIVSAMRHLAALLVAALAAAAPAQAAGQLQVVAAENFWGSIAAQLGGSRVNVTSVISNPATDPHDYEPTATDARTIAGARLVIVNGVGYDPWASKLVAANGGGQTVLDVGTLVGIAPGGNPHRWYSPTNVQQVIGAIVRDYDHLDPGAAAYFAQREHSFETKGLARYKQLLATIKRRFHGVAVGASESIFAPLAQALGLDLVTPSTFLNAISEGTEPTASDIETIDRQIAKKQLAVWVYNSQNSTPDVQRITEAARKRGIPVTTITETLAPATSTFQAWQVRELEALEAALAKATGR